MSRYTTEQLRADIDAGRMGDKVAGSDPAAAPLGTDDEAAGTPARADAVQDMRTMRITPPNESERAASGPGAAWILIGFIVAVAVLLIAAATGS